MSDFTYYVPTEIKTPTGYAYLKRQWFVGNTDHAKKETKRLRKENPDSIIRRNHGTITEYN